MNVDLFHRERELSIGHFVLGRPYRLGAKWPVNENAPTGPVDCSGFSRWYLFQCRGIFIPDGSYNQIKVCTRLPGEQQENPPPLSLGFYAPTAGSIDHVVVVYDENNVIEARGTPYDAVIERPIRKWLDQRGFLGFYAPPEPEANI